MSQSPTRRYLAAARSPTSPSLVPAFFFLLKRQGKEKPPACPQPTACRVKGVLKREEFRGWLRISQWCSLPKTWGWWFSCSTQKGLCCALAWVSFPGSADTPNSPFLLQFPTQVTLCAPPAPLPLGWRHPLLIWIFRCLENNTRVQIK